MWSRVPPWKIPEGRARNNPQALPGWFLRGEPGHQLWAKPLYTVLQFPRVPYYEHPLYTGVVVSLLNKWGPRYHSHRVVQTAGTWDWLTGTSLGEPKPEGCSSPSSIHPYPQVVLTVLGLQEHASTTLLMRNEKQMGCLAHSEDSSQKVIL